MAYMECLGGEEKMIQPYRTSGTTGPDVLAPTERYLRFATTGFGGNAFKATTRIRKPKVSEVSADSLTRG